MISTLLEKTALTLFFFSLLSITLVAQRFEFALIGDMPYDKSEEAKFRNLVREINNDQGIRWVLHTGDIKNGATPCSDQYFKNRLAVYQQFKKPFILTPGDNEWTDCYRPACGGYAPLDRLEALRKIFFAEPQISLGQKKLPLESQSKLTGFSSFPENQRWEKNGVWFATCHIVGSFNATKNFPGRSKKDDLEVEERTKAAIFWLQQTFYKAKTAKAVFIMIHANPKLEKAADPKATPGFYDFLAALEKEVIRFGKPVLLAHGDSHYFRYDKPLVNRKNKRRIENFTRLESFGARDVHWVRVIVNPKDPNIFQIRQEIVDDNLEQH